MNISEIDPNLYVPETIQRDGLRFYDILDKPFKIFGIMKPEENEHGYKRMPPEIAAKVSDGVRDLNWCTAGGRLRFKTDSSYVAIHAEMPEVCRSVNFAMTGSIGLDLYEIIDGEQRFVNTFAPPWSDTPISGYDSIIDFPGKGMHDVVINFPLYSHVSKLCIGLNENSHIEESGEYRNALPVVFYGSSITQGGCASRPGMCYESILSRELNIDYINLGFSGSAKAEDTMIEYIKGLEMSVFVLDYDHNAPNAEHLKKTHKKMFDAVRAAQPELPILILPAPKYNPNEEWKERKRIVFNTYAQAVAAGDKNVYYIDGAQLMLPYAKGDGTVDNCHPTDLGFMSMAENIKDVLKRII